ncbi:MAG TPA: toll/interleukin-1 receptor domain-containing protein [Pyrinomonadaceae bacterium]|jgi:hypothetical protein|nr:toll/interleukin-1 receptor domain-containing protein [Pyrinomonadaceae bacterium]
MAGKLVFISSREREMRHYREAAERAIAEAGMRHVFVEPGTVKRGVGVARQIEEAVRSAHVFVGLYGYTLDDNPKPKGSDKHYLELEFGWAQEAGLPCLCYAPQYEEDRFDEWYVAPAPVFDADMGAFRREFLDVGVGWLTTPQALHDDLLAQLRALDPRIFISYSSADLEFVRGLYERLRESGYRPWFNAEDIAPGDPWQPEMMAGLDETSVILLVVSPAAMESDWVTLEWQKFFGLKKPILQLLYRETETPPELKAIQGIKYAPGGDDWYFDLLREIKARL